MIECRLCIGLPETGTAHRISHFYSIPCSLFDHGKNSISKIQRTKRNNAKSGANIKFSIK